MHILFPVRSAAAFRSLPQRLPWVIPAFGAFLFVFQGTVVSQEQLPECEWCGAEEGPQRLSWEDTIATHEEPGEPLEITGRVFKVDGTTPSPDVILYFYHTNAMGIYPRRGNEKGNGRRHGYLRGWIRTDEGGRYRLVTIRPAPYPAGTEPAHIHVVVLEPGGKEYPIDSYLFSDDPLVTDAVRSRLENRGGNGIVTVRKDDAGIWQARRDITLLPDRGRQ